MVDLAALAARESWIVAGLMSGTSMDGLDIAVCRFERPLGGRVTLLAGTTVAMPSGLRRALDVDARVMSAAEGALLDMEVGRWFADALGDFCAGRGLTPDLVGSHGQTVYHAHKSTTLQLGEAAFVAQRMGCPVVADFRRADIAAGGCGAPLVPIFDRLVLAEAGAGVLALNLGGIANFTAVPPRERLDEALIAFDCGPANMPIDLLVRRMSGGAETFDRDGQIAAAGTLDAPLLRRLQADPYYALPPPRSCGREEYGEAFVERLLRERPPASPDDWRNLVATVSELAAWAVGDAYRRHVAPTRSIARAYISGGGAANPHLVVRLAHHLAPLSVADTGARGVDPDLKEAMAFALLAALFITDQPGNVPEVTGAPRPVKLGRLSLP